MSEVATAVALSLGVALVATVVQAPLAIAVGYATARGRGAGRALLEGVAMAPLVLPPLVTGWLLLTVLGPKGPLGALLAAVGIRVAFTTGAAVIASAVMGFPLFVRAVQLSVRAVDPGLEEAARTLGASRIRVLRTITLPLALPGVAAGAVLAFARSLGEFGATIVFAGSQAGRTRTLPLELYHWLQVPGGESQATGLVGIALLLSLLALLASELLARRTRVDP